jgi:hypothetical protein
MSSFWAAVAFAIFLALGANVVLGAMQKEAVTAYATEGVRL